MSVRPSVRTRTWWQRGLALTAATATAVALGSLSGTADAGPGSGWDRLADCESGQNWNLNTGNGYYGGLQFAKESWDWAGGERYAQYPHQASREEQIATAERLLERQALSNAWPACSAKLGLSVEELRSGSTDDAESSGDDGSEDADSSSSTERDGGSDEGSDDESDAGGDDESDEAAGGTYEVRAGDSLAAIAARLDVDGGWRALYEANADAIAEPGVIHVGQHLVVPGGSPDGDAAASSSGTYRVHAGDTLVSIANAEAVPGGWSAIYRANDDVIDQPDLIRVGQVLDLP